MNYSVMITEPAEQDINEAILYIANTLQNKTAAIQLLDDVQREINTLSEMPGRFGLVNDKILSTLGIRMFPIKNYLIFYVVREEQVNILRFLYSKRDWLNLLKSDL